MGLSRDKITGAYTMDINYRKKDWGADFYIPEPNIQNSSLTFDKLKSFGFKICAPYSFIYDPYEPSKILNANNAPSAEEQNAQEYAEGYQFDLGLEIELPPGTAFLVLSLDEDSFESYVLDNGEPNKFFPITLYCKKAKPAGTVKEYKEGTPLLWVLPIPDMAYSYQYRNKGGKIG
tara:strand:- start:26 stop:553 length:528 start_codon:yes stop_codon:yes gene_type:complete